MCSPQSQYSSCDLSHFVSAIAVMSWFSNHYNFHLLLLIFYALCFGVEAVQLGYQVTSYVPSNIQNGHMKTFHPLLLAACNHTTVPDILVIKEQLSRFECLLICWSIFQACIWAKPRQEEYESVSFQKITRLPLRKREQKVWANWLEADNGLVMTAESSVQTNLPC